MSELSVFESAKQEYEKEIYDLKQEIEYLRSVGSLGILDRKCKELQNKYNKQKEVIDKIKEYCKNTINRYEDYIGKEDIVRENKFILELLEEIE